MALHFKVSNQLQSLAHSLIEEGTHGMSIFQPLFIITQTSGMNNWLTLQLAKGLGIAANIQYVQPAQFIFEVYQLLLDEKIATIGRNNVDWLIYQALSEDTFKKRFPYQYQYFVENGQTNEVKKWELAAKVADLFDQYQVYRHDIIQQWNKEHFGDVDKKFEWQYYLWNRIKELSGTFFPDLTEMHRQILKWLDQPQKIEKLKSKYPKIHLFGISIVTKLHIQIIYKLSEYIDFHFYLLNPAPEVLWEYDIHPNLSNNNRVEYTNVGNPLLTGWGKVLQNTSKLLFSDDAIFNLREEVGIEYPQPSTLLKSIQLDIAQNVPNPSTIPNSFLEDGTIKVCSTYSIQSEIEALYNYLLDNTQKTQFNEKDVLVIVTDINLYAPYIKAVFDNAPYTFQYSIADESIITSDSFVAALAAIISLESKPFSAEEILDLFQFSIIRKKFGITDLDFIRRAIEKVNIRYGIQNNKEDDTVLVSWYAGLQRMIYGICMEEEKLINIKGRTILPINITDQQNEMHQLFRLTHFVDKLMQHIKSRELPRNLSGWKMYIEDIIRTFLNDETAETEEKSNDWIQQQLKFEYLDDLLNNDQIPFEVFRKRLEARLQFESIEGKFLNRGITFCSPLPFRSIPFKIIGFIGLNMNDFPRKESYSDLDIIKNNYQIDDRNIRENDKHLFLESLLSAEEKLYLSFIGKSNKDNTKLPPSVLVDELLDYVQDALNNDDLDVRKILIEQKPLHLYSSQYNQQNSKLSPNYLIKKSNPFPIPSIPNATKEIFTDELYSIQKNDILSFARNGIKYFYNHALNIYLNDINGSIEPVEEFSLNPLMSYSIANGLLQDRISKKLESHQSLEKWHHLGVLPLKNMEEISLQPILKNYKIIFDKVDKNIQLDELKTINLDFQLSPKIRIKDKISYLYNNTLYAFHPFEKVKNHHLFNWLLSFHLANVSTQIDKMIIHTPKHSYFIKEINKAQSMNLLIEWANYTINGMQTMYCFGLDIIFDKPSIQEDDFENSFEKAVEQKLSFDRYFNIAVEKKQHLGKHKEFAHLKKIFYNPLEAIEKTNITL